LETDQPYINIHTHLPAENGTISIFNAGVNDHDLKNHNFVSIGIHPWHIRTHDLESSLDFIRKNAGSEKVLAIGECGIDKLIDIPISDQERIFIEQIKIADEVKKPLIVHCVKAFAELIRIKKYHKIKVPLIVHGFNNTEQTAEQLIEHGFYLSFGKALTNNNSNAQHVIKKMDPHRFFLETDDGDSSINSIFEKASELKNMKPDELKRIMLQNFKTVINNG
jgi:TatD DNase family protein